jgi:hypothetical protein
VIKAASTSFISIFLIVMLFSYFSWYFCSRANIEPDLSSFKSQSVALSFWCVTFLVWLFFSYCFQIFWTFAHNSHGPNDYRYDKTFHVPHLLNLCTLIFSSSFCVTFLSDYIVTAISKQILSLFLIIKSGLFYRTSLFVCTPWFHNAVIPSRSVAACIHTLSWLFIYSLFARVGHPDLGSQ